MNCYRCNAVLDLKKETCTKCGTDVRFFKKIVYASNRYYNEGLVKAQARDLSGARDALKISLNLYKRNTDARNLLGLVYYAMGESAEGLRQWTLSKNLTKGQNIAERFINTMHRNMRDMDSEAHGIRKYNQALGYARNNAKDLAAIQLKKVVSVHSNMTKAYELLALLYMDDEKYEQARKVLNRCLEVDRGNVSALHYLNELDAMEGHAGIRSAGVVGDEEREKLIIPVRFRDYGTYLANALYIFLGLFLGLAIAWFVVVPGRVEKELGSIAERERSYESVISSLQEEIAKRDLEKENAERESHAAEETQPTVQEEEPEEPKQRVPVIEKLTNWDQNHAAVTKAITALYEPEGADYVTFTETFFSISGEDLGKGDAGHYRDLCMAVTDAGVFTDLYMHAQDALIRGDYRQAAGLFDAASLIRPEDGMLRYNAAVAYEGAEDYENAANRFWQICVLFPEMEQAEDAKNHYLYLTQETEVPPLPEGEDPASYRQPVTFEMLTAGLPAPEDAAEDPSENPEISPEEMPVPEYPAVQPESPEGAVQPENAPAV